MSQESKHADIPAATAYCQKEHENSLNENIAQLPEEQLHWHTSRKTLPLETLLPSADKRASDTNSELGNRYPQALTDHKKPEKKKIFLIILIRRLCESMFYRLIV